MSIATALLTVPRVVSTGLAPHDFKPSSVVPQRHEKGRSEVVSDKSIAWFKAQFKLIEEEMEASIARVERRIADVRNHRN